MHAENWTANISDGARGIVRRTRTGRRVTRGHFLTNRCTVRAMKRPGKSDPSRPREDGYDYKREFYRSEGVVATFDRGRPNGNARRLLAIAGKRKDGRCRQADHDGYSEAFQRSKPQGRAGIRQGTNRDRRA